MKKIFSTVLLSTASIVLFAQDAPWTLKQCVDYAIEHNLDVRQIEISKSVSDIELNTARNSMLPYVSASAGGSVNWGKSIGANNVKEDQTNKSVDARLSASVDLFNAFNKRNTIDKKKLDLQAAMEDFNKAKEDVSLNVAAYFLNVLYQYELQCIAEEQLRLSMDQLEETRQMVAAGKVAESEYYDAQASLAKDESELVSAQNDYKLALLNLSQMLNLPSPENFSVTVSESDLDLLHGTALVQTVDEVYNYTVNNRPSVKAADVRLQSAQKDIAIKKSAYYPSLSLSAGYGSSYYKVDGKSADSFSSQWSDNGNEYISLNLSIPIFNRFATRNSVRVSRLALDNQQVELEKARSVYYKEVQQAYFNASAALSSFNAAQKSVQASQEALRYESEKYRAGKSTVFQFNEKQTAFVKAQMQSAQAKFSFIFRSKILAYYNGTEF